MKALFSTICTAVLFRANGVRIGRNWKSNGCPEVDVWPGGSFIIGDNFKINNGGSYNLIGRQQKCIFVVSDNAILQIGDNVGMSAVAIVCRINVVIGNDVKIGGNTVIYDTDFHSLDPECRKESTLDKKNTVNKPVIIEDNVFIGAHCTILKGVTIGKNSVVGASSVVTKDIPKNEIWAGNPAKFIRSLQQK